VSDFVRQGTGIGSRTPRHKASVISESLLSKLATFSDGKGADTCAGALDYIHVQCAVVASAQRRLSTFGRVQSLRPLSFGGDIGIQEAEVISPRLEVLVQEVEFVLHSFFGDGRLRDLLGNEDVSVGIDLDYNRSRKRCGVHISPNSVIVCCVEGLVVEAFEVIFRVDASKVAREGMSDEGQG